MSAVGDSRRGIQMVEDSAIVIVFYTTSDGRGIEPVWDNEYDQGIETHPNLSYGFGKAFLFGILEKIIYFHDAVK